MNRREFLTATAALGAIGGVRAVEAKESPVDKMKTIRKGLGGGKVIGLGNRTPSQMFGAVFVSPNGRVAVVDGGYWGDGPNLAQLLRSLGGRVDFWLITHAHSDHYGALGTILEKPDCEGLSIGKICHAFPDRSWTDRVEPSTAPFTKRFAAALARHPELVVERLVKGRSFDLGGGWSFETLNDVSLDLAVPNINDTSVCFTALLSGRRWLVTGDVAVQTGRRLVKELGDRLRHEFVFMAHHGQQGAEKAFYAKVAPQTAIWPTPTWLWENDIGKGPGSGPFMTNYTKCWMQELGVKEHIVLTQDVLFV